MDIGENKGDTLGKFEEKGGSVLGAKNWVKYQTSEKLKLPVDDSRTYGIDPAVGGWGNTGVSGEVIAPDGGHGHLFLRFQPPKARRDGALQVGLETTAPHAKSPVGYKHDMWSSEKTRNPESSVHGHKEDKTGEGKLNQSIVDLREFRTESGGWQDFLRELDEYWTMLVKNVEEDPEEIRRLYQRLVGPRDEYFRPPSARGGPAGAPSTG